MESTELNSKKLANWIGLDLPTWQALLKDFGMESRIAGNKQSLYVFCPHCSTPKAHLRVLDSAGIPNWRCYVCSSQKTWHSSYLGLFRMALAETYGRDLSPLQVMGELIDWKLGKIQLGEAPPVRMTFGKHEGKNLQDVPRSYLVYLLNEPNQIDHDEMLFDEINAYAWPLMKDNPFCETTSEVEVA